MQSKKAAVDELQEKLKSFVSSTVKAEDFDVIIPIMRKGLFLLDRLFPKERKFKILLLESTEDRLPANVSLKDKKVLIIDDSSRTGCTIIKAKQGIISNNSALEKNIRTAVFMKCKDCAAKIDYFVCEFDTDNGAELYALLSNYFDSLCHQLDPDHLVIQGKLKLGAHYPDQKAVLSNLKSELEKFGDYYEQQESICQLWGRSKFSVVELRASDFGLDGYSPLWTEEGVFKVRFCLEPDWTLYIVPIFCPEIIPPAPSAHGACEGLVTSRFCDGSKSLSDTLCRDCISYNLTRNFCEKFVLVFKMGLESQGFSYSVLDLVWPEIQLRYEELQKRIFADFKESQQKMQ